VRVVGERVEGWRREGPYRGTETRFDGVEQRASTARWGLPGDRTPQRSIRRLTRRVATPTGADQTGKPSLHPPKTGCFTWNTAWVARASGLVFHVKRRVLDVEAGGGEDGVATFHVKP
jgi:hypothetical protein